MTDEQQLKLQGFLDGELPEDEARSVASWIARDAEATALVGELRNTRRALKESQPSLRVPESREFYWSKIQREIERVEQQPRPAPSISLLSWVRRLAAGGAAASVVVAAVWLGLQGSPSEAVSSDAEMTVADSGTFTYRDYANRTTLVWVTYPAER